MELRVERRSGQTPVYFLGGPTASGKTELAHRLADRHGMRLLSADSMMVYRGMDVGTAKPTPEEIRGYDYAGVDLVDPGGRFSVGDWLRAVREQLDERPVIAVGGTGLYFQVLVRGLGSDVRESVEPETEDVEALRGEIRERAPEALERLADPHNPRRLARALARLRVGEEALPSDWTEAGEISMAVLRVPVEVLDARIRERAERMFAGGLLEEAERLRRRYGGELGTAAQAIGYREAFEVLEGRASVEEAVEAVRVRTRRYAKRQRTWFRNQVDARWVDRDAGRGERELTDAVEAVWRETGPFWFVRRSL